VCPGQAESAQDRLRLLAGWSLRPSCSCTRSNCGRSTATSFSDKQSRA